MFSESPNEHPDLAAFAAICSEATQRHGDNWPAVEQLIRERVGALPRDQRERLAAEIDRVLRYCAPDKGAQTQ
jgi:hypothetical protein